MSNEITDEMIESLAKNYDIEPKIAKAVFEVESSSKGFDDKDRMIIRFENHWFYRFWGIKTPDNLRKFSEYFSFSKEPNKNHQKHKFRFEDGEWNKFHLYPDREWKVFKFAQSLDKHSAIKSISMGASQIMGFNYERIGYESPEDMYDHFNSSIKYHIKGFFDFMPQYIIDKLKNQDFYAFAKFYNGPANADVYAGRIKDKWNQIA